MQDMFALGDDNIKEIEKAFGEMYGEMLVKAYSEVAKENFPGNASVTIKRKSKLEMKFQGEPKGIAYEVVSSDKVSIGK